MKNKLLIIVTVLNLLVGGFNIYYYQTLSYYSEKFIEKLDAYKKHTEFFHKEADYFSDKVQEFSSKVDELKENQK